VRLALHIRVWLCEGTPVILHGVVSPLRKVTPVIPHGVVSPRCKVTRSSYTGLHSQTEQLRGMTP